MSVHRNIVLSCVALAAAAVCGLAAAEPGSSSDPSQWPPQVREKVQALQASGVQVRDVRMTPFTPATAGLQALPFSWRAHPQQLPSSCKLWVLIYRTGTQIHNTSYTVCSAPADQIQMVGDLSWSQGSSWLALAQNQSAAYATDASSVDVAIDCSLAGISSYLAMTNAYVQIAGVGYQASGWNELTYQSCQ